MRQTSTIGGSRSLHGLERHLQNKAVAARQAQRQAQMPARLRREAYDGRGRGRKYGTAWNERRWSPNSSHGHILTEPNIGRLRLPSASFPGTRAPSRSCSTRQSRYGSRTELFAPGRRRIVPERGKRRGSHLKGTSRQLMQCIGRESITGARYRFQTSVSIHERRGLRPREPQYRNVMVLQEQTDSTAEWRTRRA